MKSQVQISKKFLFSIDGKKGNFNRAPLGCFSKSIDVGRQTCYLRLNSTSSESIFQMTLTSLPAQ